MELITLLAVPTLTALIAPVVLEMVKKRIDKRKEERDRKYSLTDLNIQIGDDLRDELREENVGLKSKVEVLEDKLNQANASIKEMEAWQSKFYSLKKENQRLEFDLMLMVKEVEFLRERYEEYVKIRERFEDRFGGAEDA